MSVTNLLREALYTKLSGGTALTALLASGSSIYYMQAYDNAPLPYVVFDMAAGGPENINGSDLRSEVVMVKGYGTSADRAGSIDAACSSLLHKGSLSVTGYVNIWCCRETDISLLENTPSGEKVWMSGGYYRVRLTD